MKKIIRLTESDIHRMVMEAISSLNLDQEGSCGLPGGVDDIILSAESDRGCMSQYEMIVNTLLRKKRTLEKNGVKLDVLTLANSRVMANFWRMCFNYYREITDNTGRNLSENPDPNKFKIYMAQKMIGQIENGEYTL